MKHPLGVSVSCPWSPLALLASFHSPGALSSQAPTADSHDSGRPHLLADRHSEGPRLPVRLHAGVLGGFAHEPLPPELRSHSLPSSCAWLRCGEGEVLILQSGSPRSLTWLPFVSTIENWKQEECKLEEHFPTEYKAVNP